MEKRSRSLRLRPDRPMTTLALFCILASCRQRGGTSQRREGRVYVGTADETRAGFPLLFSEQLHYSHFFFSPQCTLYRPLDLTHWQLKRLPAAAAPDCRLTKVAPNNGRAKLKKCTSVSQTIGSFQHKCTVGRCSILPRGILHTRCIILCYHK